MKTYTSKSKELLDIYLCVIVASLIITISINESIFVQAQVVSHELRRLAISTNQFGIDVLKSLDRIEPPDKVIVFCPVCLSSSLMMIMMGSSKYQVVSSFRQALYVWSMKPHEINRGFKDIFDHIGLNQQLNESKEHLIKTSIKPSFDMRARYYHHHHRMKRASYRENDNNDNLLYNNFESNNVQSRYLSLPKLMKIKEMLDKSMNDELNPWWNSIKSDLLNNNVRRFKGTSATSTIRYDKLESKESLDYMNKQFPNQTTSNMMGENNHQTLGRDLTGDSSQMSATSNIYIQRGLNMNYNYNLLLRQYYKTVIHPVDFFRNAEETRQHINSLVAANTEGKIKDLVKKTTFENVTQPKIMIISTFHFRGTLDVQIKDQDNQDYNNLSLKSNNEKNTTILNDNLNKSTQQSSVNQMFIETEKSLLKYGQFSHLDCSVVEIPFNNRLVSLIIVMPNNFNSTELLITRLSAQVLSDMVNSLVVRRISIEIPVIKFDRGPINVDGLLRELGLNHYFFGDKIQTTETGLNKWMRPADIIHETSIDIGTINPRFGPTEDRLKVGAHDNEPLLAPTTTTTTTTLQPDTNMSKQQLTISKGTSSSQVGHIKLDKPFFYFVLDSLNGLILTMGRIRQ